MLVNHHRTTKTIALVGLESSGKTTLFARLTNYEIGKESNIKGSTYHIKSQTCAYYPQILLIDTPGFRGIDNQYETLLSTLLNFEHLIFVVRGTNFHSEINALRPLIDRWEKSFSIAVTFLDKMSAVSLKQLNFIINKYSLPITLIDGRYDYKRLTPSLLQNTYISLSAKSVLYSTQVDEISPADLCFDKKWIGPILSIIVLFLLFTIPVMSAYLLSSILQPLADKWIVQPFTSYMSNTIPLISALLSGNYGLFSLGVYSFVWAFPVVVLVTISTSLADETGLKDRITDTLDKPMRKIGLNGQDLIPFLTGFGCNVVAVYQTRLCSACTRKQCVSLISFGSACSYQIGATLSIFNTIHRPWLFLPYLIVLTSIGAIHNKIWTKNANQHDPFLKQRRAFLQRPTINGIMFRIKSVLKQFLTQAMPIFFIICFIATLLDSLSLLQLLSMAFKPILQLLNIPIDAATALAFSFIRKDGLLLLNENKGVLLSSLPDSTVFLLVYLGSTLSACFVTLWAIRSELGFKVALSIFGKQIITSIVSTFLFFILFSL
ncbi:nucleoside recognition domain-containing protein [Priestia megaterium]|uniref:nucleoside recognition domain-containing protein n=2 Tax=Priestia megaterium TaxID=1404 RepID=UPI0013E2B3DF|nr:nucleoside recognition domain-containing protein [Priestia megaterium]MED3866107.1 50S ribosome-binding GTPase [Priestia megaterium]MED4101011.1 50S ribosome-binding GTPase [Priestia megaterium]MED4145436.1 50S ribosome-binding GTPase [Priestia megaterium]MED4170758.1 50S ribosome-binding GTPase [Priestia megaterium]